MKPLQILLDPEQHEIISEVGSCFVVVHRSMITDQPDLNGRTVLHLVPCSVNAANSAIRVAMGKSAERRPRTAKMDTKSDAVGKLDEDEKVILKRDSIPFQVPAETHGDHSGFNPEWSKVANHDCRQHSLIL